MGQQLERAFSYNALFQLSEELTAAIPHVIWDNLLTLALSGLDHVDPANKRAAFHMFFKPSSVRLKPHQLPGDTTYHVTTDGVGLSWTVERPWPDPQHARPQRDFVADANRNANVDMMALQRGCVRLDRGVINLAARLAIDSNPVISIDPGIVNVVTAADADIVDLINHNPNLAEPILRQHILQVKHGQFRQVMYQFNFVA